MLSLNKLLTKKDLAEKTKNFKDLIFLRIERQRGILILTQTFKALESIIFSLAFFPFTESSKEL